MGTGPPTLDEPISPGRVPHRHVLRAREVMVCAGIAAAAWFLCGAAGGTFAVDGGARHPVPAKPSPAAITAFYRRAKERAAKFMGKPAPKWKVCPRCELAYHGTDRVAENPASGHTPGDWQP